MINIKTIPIFDQKIKELKKKYKSIKKDYKNLLDSLNNNPDNAINIKENIYKIRIKNSDINKWKSSWYRIYYFYKNSDDLIILMYIYSKKEKNSLSDKELDELIFELNKISTNTSTQNQ